MKRRTVLLVGLIGACAVAGLVAASLTTHSAGATGLYAQLAPIQKRILSGFATLEVNPVRGVASAANQQPKTTSKSSPSTFGCPDNIGNDQRVNQNCLNISDSNLQGRSQAENETA